MTLNIDQHRFEIRTHTHFIVYVSRIWQHCLPSYFPESIAFQSIGEFTIRLSPPMAEEMSTKERNQFRWMRKSECAL